MIRNSKSKRKRTHRRLRSFYRKLKSLTQEQLAEIPDCGVSFIGQIEAPNIYKAISLDTLFKIAKALEIPPYKLLYFDD